MATHDSQIKIPDLAPPQNFFIRNLSHIPAALKIVAANEGDVRAGTLAESWRAIQDQSKFIIQSEAKMEWIMRNGIRRQIPHPLRSQPRREVNAMVARISQSFPLLEVCIDDWPLMYLFQFKIDDMRRNTGRVTSGIVALAQQGNVNLGPLLPQTFGVNAPGMTTEPSSNGATVPGIAPTAQMVVNVAESTPDDDAPETPEHQSDVDNTFNDPYSNATKDSKLPVQSEAPTEDPPELSQRQLRKPRSTNNVPIAARQPSRTAQKRVSEAKHHAAIAAEKITAIVESSKGQGYTKKKQQLIDDAKEKEERLAKGKQRAVTRNEKNTMAQLAAQRLQYEGESNGLEIDEDEELFTDFNAPFKSLQGGHLVDTFFNYKRQKRSD